MAIEIVAFPIKNGGSFHCYVSSPEGIHHRPRCMMFFLVSLSPFETIDIVSIDHTSMVNSRINYPDLPEMLSVVNHGKPGIAGIASYVFPIGNLLLLHWHLSHYNHFNLKQYIGNHQPINRNDLLKHIPVMG